MATAIVRIVNGYLRAAEGELGQPGVVSPAAAELNPPPPRVGLFEEGGAAAAAPAGGRRMPPGPKGKPPPAFNLAANSFYKCK